MMSLSVLLIASLSLASGGTKFYVGRRDKKLNWHQARAKCECWGGRLATFSNGKEFDQMVSALDNGALGDRAWIGMSKLDGEWEFIDGETGYCTRNSNPSCEEIPEWNQGEPNNPDSEKCAELLRPPYGVLNNLPCSEEHYYLCEFNTDNYVIAIEQGDLAAPQIPWIPEGSGPQPRWFGTYSAQDLMVVALAVTLAVFCLRAKGTATVRYYSKVVADSEEDSRLNA